MSDIKNLVIDRWFLELYNYSVRYHEGDESAHAKMLAIQDEIRSLMPVDKSQVNGSLYDREIIDLDCLIQAIVGWFGCEGLKKIMKEHDELLEFIER